ncbi:hypothetical protein ACWDRB_67405 [Nonomuraea sp. NPDC003707]
MPPILGSGKHVKVNRRPIRWWNPTALLSIVALAATVVLVWHALDRADKVNVADLAAVAIAAAAAAPAVVTWAKRRNTAASRPVDVTRAADVLADLVRRQWQNEARHRLLDDPEPIPVRWQLTANEAVMNTPRLISTTTAFTFAGSSDNIAALARDFRALTRQRLVIAGGAGTGKTTLAIQLLLQLLSTRTADQTSASGSEILPVPVLLPVSGWDTRTHPRLQDWLTVRLAQDYPALAGPQLGAGAAALADGGHILPVLDGLDEIPAPARAQVIAALNASLTARDQLILTSRRVEFTTAIHEAGRPLTAAAVIVPKPVTPQAAADYLTACLPASPTEAWTQVLTALRFRSVPGLTRLAATPLGLWLIRTVYLAPGIDPGPLTGPLGSDVDALRAHLLDLLIPSLIQARPPSTNRADHFRPRHRLDPDATRRYLTYLARAFPLAATGDIAWWHIARTTPHIRSTVGLTVGLAVGLGAVLTNVLTNVLTGGLDAVLAGLTTGLAAGLTTGLGGGLIVGLALAISWTNETPGYADLHLRGRTLLLLRSIKSNLVGLETLLQLWGIHMRWNTPVFPFLLWAEQPTPTSTITSRSSWQADRALTLLGMLFVLGPLFAFVIGSTAGLGVSTGIWAGLMAGLAVGRVVGPHQAWLVCAIAVSRLALEHQLPWRFMDFLDDAHRLGLLRAVGPVYQFRHAALHDHLASQKEFNTQT